MAVYGTGEYSVTVKWKNGTTDEHRFTSEASRDRFLDNLQQSNNTNISSVKK